MSCFAGLLNLDGAPVDPAQLDRMADRLAYRSPDGMGSWKDGPIGMVHGRLWTTPEEAGEEQPLGDSQSDLWLVADARVDNRQELLTDPRRRLPNVDPDASDARFLLAAYKTLGPGVCNEVLGDFAFALWDGGERRLLLARDAMGLRQLYYARRGSTVLFGSTIGSVIAALPERPPLNRHLIEAFLQDSYRHWIQGTVYQGVSRLAPGHFLTVDAAGLRLQRWWRLGSTFDGSFAHDEEWAEGFREVFDLAVSSRLRCTTPIGLLAGGGVDSAAIACSAHVGLGSAGAGRLRLFGLTFDNTPTADEGEYFEALAEHLRGVEAHRIPAERLPLSLGARPAAGQPLDEPELYLLRSHTTALFDAASASGCRVVLAGEGANQALGHSFYYDPGALRFVGWRELASELPNFRARSPHGTVGLLARAYLWPLVPARLRESLRLTFAGSAKPWVCAAGRGSWRRRLPPLPRRAYAASLTPAGRWATQSIGRPFDLARYSAIDVTAAHSGVEWRLPFLDRRVVDLLLHAPRELRSWHGGDRRILRQAMVGTMPERIRRRRSKSHVKDVIDELLRHDQRAAVERLLYNPRAEAIECVNGLTAAAFRQYWNGSGTSHGLLSFLSLESWLREAIDEGDLRMSSEQTAPRAGQRKTSRRRPVRPYQAPELQEYGRLKDLTRTLSTQIPGDGFGASFAT